MTAVSKLNMSSDHFAFPGLTTRWQPKMLQAMAQTNKMPRKMTNPNRIRMKPGTDSVKKKNIKISQVLKITIQIHQGAHYELTIFYLLKDLNDINCDLFVFALKGLKCICPGPKEGLKMQGGEGCRQIVLASRYFETLGFAIFLPKSGGRVCPLHH